MVMYSFEGRIRRVWQINGRWLCDIYGTQNRTHNGVLDVKEDVVREAKELSRVPQVLAMITVKDGKVIRVEPLNIKR